MGWSIAEGKFQAYGNQRVANARNFKREVQEDPLGWGGGELG